MPRGLSSIWALFAVEAMFVVVEVEEGAVDAIAGDVMARSDRNGTKWVPGRVDADPTITRRWRGAGSVMERVHDLVSFSFCTLHLYFYLSDIDGLPPA
jgi:hypothetical protein